MFDVPNDAFSWFSVSLKCYLNIPFSNDLNGGACTKIQLSWGRFRIGLENRYFEVEVLGAALV